MFRLCAMSWTMNAAFVFFSLMIWMTTTGNGPGLPLGHGLSDVDIQDSLLLVASPDLVFEDQVATASVSTPVMGTVSDAALDRRFGEEPLSNTDFYGCLDNRTPKNTVVNTKWAVSVFREWRKWRNFKSASMVDKEWPIPALHDGTFQKLDYWLARFITEVRRQDNAPYPAGSYILNISANFLFPFFRSGRLLQ